MMDCCTFGSISGSIVLCCAGTVRCVQGYLSLRLCCRNILRTSACSHSCNMLRTSACTHSCNMLTMSAYAHSCSILRCIVYRKYAYRTCMMTVICMSTRGVRQRANIRCRLKEHRGASTTDGIESQRTMCSACAHDHIEGHLDASVAILSCNRCGSVTCERGSNEQPRVKGLVRRSASQSP